MARLVHVTSADGMSGIEADGFHSSGVGDSIGFVWFSTKPDPALAHAAEWVCEVDFDDSVEQFRYRFDDGEPYLDHYRIPIDVANQGRLISWAPIAE